MVIENMEIFKDPNYQRLALLENKIRAMRERFTVVSSDSSEVKFLITPIQLGSKIADSDVEFLRQIVRGNLEKTIIDPGAKEADKDDAEKYLNGKRTLTPGALFTWAEGLVSNEYDQIVSSYRKK